VCDWALAGMGIAICSEWTTLVADAVAIPGSRSEHYRLPFVLRTALNPAPWQGN
jgi:hypothetical protein